MNIEIINWKPEVNGKIIKIDLKVNSKFRSMYVLEEVVLLFLSLHCPGEVYIINQEQKLFFIKDFFNI